MSLLTQFLRLFFALFQDLDDLLVSSRGFLSTPSSLLVPPRRRFFPGCAIRSEIPDGFPQSHHAWLDRIQGRQEISTTQHFLHLVLCEGGSKGRGQEEPKVDNIIDWDPQQNESMGLL